MMAAPSTNDRYEALMAAAKERAARAAANASISVTVEREIVRMPADGQMKRSSERPFPVCQFSAPVPSVIERISSPVISPQAYTKAIAKEFDVPVAAIDANPLPAKDGAGVGMEASAEALDRLGLVWQGATADKVLLIIAQAIKAGRSDLTRTELLPLYNAHYNESKSDGWISARVRTLLDQKRIISRPQRRLCTVSKSGVEVGALYVELKQVRMEY